ncbi:MAG TPA: hypothetical protein DCK95_09235 [Anaerolineaceae bacterium]|nr:hypothetical protein [Anaerolineaceae bacterium]
MNNSKSPILIKHLPSSPRWLEKIVYLARLTEELEKQGFSIDYPENKAGDYLSKQLLNTSPRKITILHFHWTAYQYEQETQVGTFYNLLKYMIKLKRAKARGYKIVWTMHNYLPHDTKFKTANYLERLWMAHCADAVIVHASCGKNILAKKLLRRKDVYVIPHGNYIPFFNRLSKEDAKQTLGAPVNKPMLLFFGYIRPYKGVPDLIQAFRALPDLDAALYIVGNAQDQTSKEIHQSIHGDARIMTNLKYIPDEELAVYLSAADAVVLPYLNILGSGALMTALSFGCPVIAPAIGAFSEFLDEKCGLLYSPGNTNGLKTALAEIPNLDLTKMGENALARAQQYPWAEMVKQIANIYYNINYSTGGTNQ